MLKLQEPILMASTAFDTIAPPRFETGKAMLVAGLGERISFDNGAGIPALWNRFHRDVHDLPGRIGQVAYGVCTNGDDTGYFDYIAAVDPITLKPVETIEAPVVLAIAARVGTTRLIDNVTVRPDPS